MCECEKNVGDLTKLEPILAKCAGDRHALISVLQKAQEVYGWLPMNVIREIASRTGNPVARVIGVATFYAQFRMEPVGKHLVMLCKGTACHVNGADAIEKALNAIGLVDGGTTEDGLFSLKTVACLGCCSLSPVMTVDDDAYGSLTPAKAVEIINRIKAEGSGK